MTAPKHGLWGLSEEGRSTHLKPEDAWALYVRVRDANRPLSKVNEETAAAPDANEDGDEEVAYWVVGASWNATDDQLRPQREIL